MIDIRQRSLQEFEDYLRGFADADIRATVLHHTWKPTADDYVGLSTIEAIRRYHVNVRGWRDIGANAYTAPDRTVYNARPPDWSNFAHALISKPWGAVPAILRTIAGGDKQFLNRHGFGIETIGNFDSENPAQSWAMATSLDVLAMVHQLWDLPVSRCFFHRDVAYKSCPGNRVDKGWVHLELARRLEYLPAETPFRVSVLGHYLPEEAGEIRDDDHTWVRLNELAEAMGWQEPVYRRELNKTFVKAKTS